MRTLWLKKEDGTVWNFAPRINLYSDDFEGCWTYNHKGGGFKNKVDLQIVGKDFIPLKIESQAQTYKMTARFISERHKEFFNDFIGDFRKPLRLYCSPDGKILPTDQISKAWYHTILITEGESPFKDKNGIYNVEMTMQYLEGVWRRDIDTISTVQGISSGALVHPYVYPYFYTEGQLLNTNILNEGDTIGCIVEIFNKGKVPIGSIAYTVYDDKDKIQKCKWNIPNGLQPGRKLVVDSRQKTQSAFVVYGTTKENAKGYGEEDISFINYPELHNGNNKFSFSLDTFDDVEVTVRYQQERVVI